MKNKYISSLKRVSRCGETVCLPDEPSQIAEKEETVVSHGRMHSEYIMTRRRLAKKIDDR
jgi:hypothetical protein